MFVQTQETPNPNSLKFLPGVTVLPNETLEFTDRYDASRRSPLANALFKIEGVKSVFLAPDFITISKQDEDVEWRILKPEIYAVIVDFFSSGLPILYESSDQPKRGKISLLHYSKLL